jgi:hypothetical protein
MTELPRDICYKTGEKYANFIEFCLDEESSRSFSTSQLITFSLDPNPDAPDGKYGLPQKLHFVFSTAEVVVLGWRLGYLNQRLNENQLYTVRVVPKRYLEINPNQPIVSSITIQFIGDKSSIACA